MSSAGLFQSHQSVEHNPEWMSQTMCIAAHPWKHSERYHSTRAAAHKRGSLGARGIFPVRQEKRQRQETEKGINHHSRTSKKNRREETEIKINHNSRTLIKRQREKTERRDREKIHSRLIIIQEYWRRDRNGDSLSFRIIGEETKRKYKDREKTCP